MSETRDRYVLLCQQALVFATVAAVAAPAAAVVSLDIVSPSRPAAERIAETAPVDSGALVASAPVEPRVTEVPLVARATVGGRGVRGRALGSAARTEPQPVAGFATVGVTWRHGVEVDEDAITISVRSKQNGTWSTWQPMEYHDDHAPDPRSREARRARPGTEPLVVGDVEDVQVKARTTRGAVPPGMRLAVIDPQPTPAARREQPAIDTAHLSAFQSGDLADPVQPVDPLEPELEPEPEPDDPAMTPTAGVDVTPQPQIFSRAQWGADERMRDRSSLQYGEVHAGFVHHTVNANGYRKSQVPAIIRGIYAYHTQSRGWSDIGYNFLVDRFGRIWEGRYGGVGRPAVGAHTLGYNEYSFAMSAIGNFDVTQPSAAMVDAYARLFAWKLSLHGVSGSSTKQLVGRRYLPAINGHRDAGSTACPGRYLYARLADIRRLTATYQRSFASRNLRTTISGSAWPDLVVRDKATKTMSVVRTGGQVNFLRRTRLAGGFGKKDLIATPGDVTGDGYADVVARDRASGVTYVHPGTAAGRLGTPFPTYGGFKDVDMLTGVGDFNEDGRNDLVGRSTDTKRLWLFRGLGGGAFGRPLRLAWNWSRFTLTTGVGDFDRDRHADLVVRDTAGRLYLVPGLKRALGTPKYLGSGITAADLIAGRGDLTNDGRPDLVVHSATNRRTRVYSINADGSLGTYDGPYTRFRNVNWISGAGQFAGSGANDIVGRSRAGRLVAFPNSGGRNISKIVRTNVSLRRTNVLLNVGDWNHDGFGDVMTRSRAGQMQLRLGRGNDTFAAPVVAATGWSGLTQIVSVGDVTGDGNNDLMARVGDRGVFNIYPGDGATGITSGYRAHSAVTSNRQVAAGLYDGDGAPDTMITKSDGSLWFYRGNGPGGMTSGRKILVGLNGFDWLVGLGDLDGDRRPDLLARARSNGSLYLIPGKSNGFGPARFVAAGFGGYDRAG